MPITFTMDDEGNVTWDRSQTGEEVTPQEAIVMAAVEIAHSLGFIGHAIHHLAEAVEETRADGAIEEIAEHLEPKSSPRHPTPSANSNYDSAAMTENAPQRPPTPGIDAGEFVPLTVQEFLRHAERRCGR